MSVRTYSDVRRFGDGTTRWLWQVYLDGRMWRAGIRFGQESAEACAATALGWLESTVRPGHGETLPPLCPPGMIDLDAVERGSGDDDAA